jgi:dihydrofolate reductase
MPTTSRNPRYNSAVKKIVYDLTVSMDGYVESADGGIDWTSPGEELHTHFNERESDLAAHIYGRRMYELMAGAWPTADKDPHAPPQIVEYAKIWRAKRKFVFSTTLERVEWNTTLLRGDIAEEVERLKALPGPGAFIAIGGPTLATSLMRLGLIDEFWLYHSPIVLGGGKAMFPQLAEPIRTELVEVRRFECGVALLRYAKV